MPCVLSERSGESFLDSNHHSNAARATTISSITCGRFRYYLLTTSSRHGNVPPVIANDKTKFPHRFHTGLQVASTFSQDGTSVSAPHYWIQNANPANSPRIIFLNIVSPPIPSNHIPAQNPAGSGFQAAKILRQRVAIALKRASISCLRRCFTDHESRATEHVL